MLFLWSKAFETVKDVQIDRSTGKYRCMSTLVYQDLPSHLLQFGKKVCSSSHAAKLQPCVKFKVLFFLFLYTATSEAAIIGPERKRAQ